MAGVETALSAARRKNEKKAITNAMSSKGDT